MEIVIFLLLVFLAGKVITVVGVVGAEAISPIIGAPVSAVGLGTCMFIPPLPPPLLRYVPRGISVPRFVRSKEYFESISGSSTTL